MEQRPLRLGDVVDDYCPRERRITNHAIVAIVDDTIRQTRCTTCDAEHAYKGAKAPRRRPKDDVASLTDQVLANANGGQLVPTRGVNEDRNPDASTRAAGSEAESNGVAAAEGPWRAPEASDGNGETANEEPQPEHGQDEVWSGHRQLIRATLPRTAGDQPAPRPIPEFTMHQRSPRGHRPHHAHGGHGWHGASGGNGSHPGKPAHPHGGGGGRRRRRHSKNRPR
jgi:hypothetical protein